jgi:hypothetical protein
MLDLSEKTASFNPETMRLLGSALDDAWDRLQTAQVYFNGSADAARTILAKHLISMAKQGERDRQRLIAGALARISL